ncbi:PREDICTED: putative UPF0481 protein At3g02645 isoform X5 [Ipomoea nil]|uniref:putative UPF0481 protein At3g02645 isoform X5 n=1 Tax=Ipomoea nil TaxID=35883 RepID=UPI000900C7F1|nr:PREDICTED: putative UPF0481 protein At3g02645 isoform X5 [Ipomoea nil]
MPNAAQQYLANNILSSLGNSPGMAHFEADSKVQLLGEPQEKASVTFWPCSKEGDSTITIDIKEEKLNRQEKYISKVNEALTEPKQDAYKPKRISIGPYHYNPDSNFNKVDVKKRFLESFSGKNHKFEELCRIIFDDKLVNDSRSCYNDDFPKMDNKQFGNMLMLDACFILQFMEKYSKNEGADDEFMKVKGNLVPTLIDMILFENQIPFFVLFELFKLKHHHLHPRNDNEKEDNDAVLLQKLIVLVRKCIGTQVPKLPPGNVAAHKYKPVRNGLPKHLVEVVHDLCIPRNPKCGRLRDGDDSGGIIEQINTATELEKDGVGFKKIGKVYEKYFEKEEASAKNCNPKSGRLRNNDDSGGIIEQINTATDQLEEDGVGFKKIGKVYEKYFGKKEARAKNFNAKDCTTMFDIDFSNGILKIPSFRIDDDTERLLRNMIAYEQHSTDTPVWFSDFASFMDQLIDSTEDVNLLRRRGIIVNCMAKNEMITDIFKDLCQDVITYNTFSGVIRKINLHGENAWNVLLGKLKHDLSYSPWKLISAVVGGLVASISTAYALRNLLR